MIKTRLGEEVTSLELQPKQVQKLCVENDAVIEIVLKNQNAQKIRIEGTQDLNNRNIAILLDEEALIPSIARWG